MDLRFLASGDTGLTIQLGSDVSRETSEKVNRLARSIDEARLKGVIETVPTYLSVLVHYDPIVTTQSELIEQVEQLASSSDQAVTSSTRSWRLPVCFSHAEFAPDLEFVADWAGISTSELISDITQSPLYVYMIGFAPGQPYIGDLPERIAIPRRKDPVPGVPTGSLLIATGKAVIYPNENPTGWYILGRTPLPIFDLNQKPPGLFQAGDLVQFHDVSLQEYIEIRSRLETGETNLESEAKA